MHGDGRLSAGGPGDRSTGFRRGVVALALAVGCAAWGPGPAAAAVPAGIVAAAVGDAATVHPVGSAASRGRPPGARPPDGHPTKSNRARLAELLARRARAHRH